MSNSVQLLQLGTLHRFLAFVDPVPYLHCSSLKVRAHEVYTVTYDDLTECVRA